MCDDNKRWKMWLARAPAWMSCARTDIDRWLRTKCALHTEMPFFVSLHKWSTKKAHTTHSVLVLLLLLLLFCSFFFIRFITPARHLVHNTSQLHAIVCSVLALNRSMAYPVFKQCLYTSTYTHQCLILNIPLWLLLFFRRFYNIIFVVAGAVAAAVSICCINSRGPDYNQMETLDLSSNCMYLIWLATSHCHHNV